MFAYIKGLLIATTAVQAVVEVNGIGYLISIPCHLLGQLPAIGQPVQLYTSFVVRENAHTLYGFAQLQERDAFELLMNVSGIGPKLALSLIGHLPLMQLKVAVEQHDLTSLCRVPGVGKKTAERLVIELRDKLTFFGLNDPTQFVIATAIDPKQQLVNDAMQALLHLGYTQSVAQKAIKHSLKELPDEVDLSTLLRVSLQNV
jgi:Holliday junction DNA helicase RuvA